jgi:hypothetical protein
MGVTIAVPTPLKEYAKSIKLKLETKKQPIADIVTDNRPNNSSDLCLS